MSFTENQTDDALADLHARWHDEPGNMVYDECGWERCEFWAIAMWIHTDGVGESEPEKTCGVCGRTDVLEESLPYEWNGIAEVRADGTIVCAGCAAGVSGPPDTPKNADE